MHGKRKKTSRQKKQDSRQKKKARGKRNNLTEQAFCCACSVNFSLKRETAAMRLRRFPAQESRKKRGRIVRRKTRNESSI